MREVATPQSEAASVPDSQHSTVDGLTVRQLVEQSYRNSADHGFWDREPSPERIPNKLMLIVSEISEALESYRDPASDDVIQVPSGVVEGLLKGVGVEHDIATEKLLALYEKWLAKPKGFDVEIADAFIRLADLCGALDIDIEDAIQRKHAFNKTRPKMHGRKV
jgi:NTP pyrophosphatase (non-canonical NTP hydrolase)